jgi:hypothetical protein
MTDTPRAIDSAVVSAGRQPTSGAPLPPPSPGKPATAADVPSFTAFLKEKAHIWTGATTDEYDEVDEHHAAAGAGAAQLDLGGLESHAAADADEGVLVGQVVEGMPEFGHGMLKYWQFREGCELRAYPLGGKVSCILLRTISSI